MRRGWSLGLLACWVGALGLRMWGLAQGYPEFYGHVDEIGVAASIWNFFRTGTLRPTEFTYPAFYSYLVAAALGVSCGLGLVPRMDGWVDSLVLTSFLNPAWSALVGRTVSAAASILVVLFTYLLGQRAVGRRAGAIAALWMAFAVVPIRQAHQALPDSLMALMAILCYYFSWSIYARGAWRDYAGAGIAAGLVIATKYNGAFAALAIVAAHGARWGWQGRWQALRAGRFWVAVGLALVALFAGSPYLLLARESYLEVAKYQVSSLDFALRETTPWGWIAKSLLVEEYAVGGLMLGGTAWALLRRSPLDWLVLAVCLPTFVYLGTWTRQSLHYLLHLYPLLALEAARLFDGLGTRWWRGRGEEWKGIGLAGLLVLPNLWTAIQADRLLALPDLRSQAAAWIEAHLPDGTRLAMTWLPYCPRLALKSARQSAMAFYRNNPVAQERLAAAWQGKPAYHLVNLEVWLKQPVVPEEYRPWVDLEDPETRRVFSRGWRTLEQLRALGVEYIVLPEAAYERYLRGDPSALPKLSAAHYHYLKNRAYFSALIAPENPELELVASFTPGPGVRGDAIHIFRLRP